MKIFSTASTYFLFVVTSSIDFYRIGYYLRQGGYVIVVVCLFVSNFAKKTSERICMKFSREDW